MPLAFGGMGCRRRRIQPVASSVDAEDHLEPGAGDFESSAGVEWLVRYRALIRAALLDPYPERSCQMVCLPSFRSEYAVFVTCVDGELRIVSRVANTNLWGRHMYAEDDAGVLRPDLPVLSSVQANLRHNVEEASGAISPDTLGLLDDLWTRMLADSRPSFRGGGLDGVTYHFTNRHISAEKHSPTPKSLPGRLVAVADTMVKLAESKGAPRLQNDLVIEVRSLLRALKPVQATAWGRMTCR
jgi:hypothetical protein